MLAKMLPAESATGAKLCLQEQKAAALPWAKHAKPVEACFGLHAGLAQLCQSSTMQKTVVVTEL